MYLKFIWWISYVRYNLASSDNLNEVRSLIREVGLRILVPAIIRDNEEDADIGPLGVIMAEAACKGFNASYMLILYSHLEGKTKWELNRPVNDVLKKIITSRDKKATKKPIKKVFLDC